MDSGQSNEESRVAPELYFLVAKLLSSGPLKETTEVLRRELEKCKILPRRLDWEGREHDQTFEELEIQYPGVSPEHLLSVCTALLKTEVGKPKRSLLCTSLYCPPRDKKYSNVLDRLLSRQEGGSRNRLLPSTVYGSLQLQRRTLGHLSAVYCVLFDRTGRYIITGADDLLVKIWSAVDGRLLGTLRGASAEITDMAVDTDNHLLAAGSLDRLVRVWDMQTAAPVAVLQGHNGMITSVHFCPARSGDLSCLVSTSTDGSVAFWTYSHSNGGKPCFISKPVQYVERMRPGACQMICGAWSPGGAFLAAGSADHHVRVYMMAENGPKRILETAAHCEAVDSLQWAHTGLRFVSGSKDGTAILWQLHAMQWRHIKLSMSDTLPGEKASTEEHKKMKVTMVGWDCTDSYVITAVNDYTLKVWCSQTGKLVRVLRGHSDEIYVLEAHPRHPAVLLSAGHDGKIFIWDILKGISLGSFQNHIDGQGHGAVFDAKWSPDGSKVAATDSHGHILMLGLGRGHPLLQTLPTELFFHTDYRPLVRDALGGVCDEQTGAPPHLMPPPFLVDVEGAPHSPRLQRLVPGREHAAMDQLVPDTSAGDMVIQEGEEPRSHIDYMIEALARQYNYRGYDGPAFDGPLARMPRSEGVRHSAGEWQRGDPLVRSRRAMVAPLSHAECISRRMYTEEMSQLEMSWYRREMRRRPVMINTASASGTGVNEGARGPGGRARRGGAVGRSQQRRAPSTRVYSEPPEDASSHHSDSDSSVRMSVTEYSVSNSSSSEHFENDGSGSSSSDYSDWVADQPNVPLRPPKRSKRKPIARQKYSPHPPASRKVPAPSPPEQAEQAAGQPPAGAIPAEIPEAYRPSDWLCAVQPRKAPYHPQMGDECMYFKQGHARYLEAVSEKSVYKVSVRDKPWERMNLKECESVKVVGIKYMIRPPRLVCLKLLLAGGAHFTVRYHDMPDVLDFLVLRQTYEAASERNWAPGDRFRCMIDDGWWMGAVVEGGGAGTDQFLSLRVRWDNGEYERMSPWDLEPIDDTRLPTDVGGWVAVLPSELEAVLYRPREEEWPGGDRASACQMIAAGFDQVMLLAIAEPFVAPVDLNVYPTYAYIVEYPIDLSTVKARFENHFYRRVTSAQFDVRYLATNAEKFNLTHSHIIKQARIITDLCLQIISDPFDIDVQAAYHSLMDSYQSSDSDVPLAKQTSSRNKVPVRDWVSRCRRVLNGLFAASDSVPFRESVPIDQLPEYTQVVARPMDLGTVRQRLESGTYSNPAQFAKEVRLVFSNSKTYNTNKRSRIFSMTLRLETLFETLFRPVHRNWKSARRRNGTRASDSSDDSLSDDDDCGLAHRSLQNGHASTATTSNGFNHRQDDEDSWDSDAPLRGGNTYKGKGKGKRSAPPPPAQPTRSSQRRSAAVTPVKVDPWAVGSGQDSYGDGADSDGARGGPLGGGEEDEDEDSGDSYKPSRRENKQDRRRKKGKRKRETKRRRSGKTKHNRRRPKAKRRSKRGSGGNVNLGSSSDTEVSVATGGSGKRRYESDHSFQLREPSPSESDSDTPLGNMRRLDTSRSGNDAPSTSSQLRRRFAMHSDESRAGPSGSSGRARRPARDSKRPRYNEDSEEDSIAAISKRLRAHQRPRANPITVQSRLSMTSIQIRPVQQPPAMHAQPSHSRQWVEEEATAAGGAALLPRPPSPLSVSSRGRVRKLTAKARGLLGD